MTKEAIFIIVLFTFTLYIHSLKINEHKFKETIKNVIPHQIAYVTQQPRLTTSIIVLNVDRIQKDKSQTITNSIWKKEQYSYKVVQKSNLSFEYMKVLQEYDILNKIQVGSVFDYLNLKQKINFDELSTKMESNLNYKIFTFPKNKSIKYQKKYISLTDNFKPYQQLSRISKKYKDSQQQQTQFKLQKALLREPNNPIVRQIEYQFFKQKYNIGQLNEQTSFCVYSSGYKMFSKNKYKLFFQSLSRQNYTNFHIVYIDDNSPQNEIKGIYSYIQNEHQSLKNKITIVHTLQHLGALANKYFWIRKYCNSNDIIVNIDSDDGLIGTQVFQVLNSIYINKNIWFTYTRYILSQNNNKNLYQGYSQPMHKIVKQYRNDFEHWDVSHLRTFRKQLFQKIPLYMMLQYQYDSKTNKVYPYFFQYAQDTFQIFSMLEMCGQQHYKYINDYLYVYSGAQSGNIAKCYAERQKIDDFKSRIKTPFQQLKNLNDLPKHVEKYRPYDDTFSTFKFVQDRYQKCVNQK